MYNPLAAQQGLTNFYDSLQLQNPAVAAMMLDDLRHIALYGVGGDRLLAYNAVVRVRRLAEGLSAVHIKILDRALEDLGYSLEHIYKETTF